jgi:ATP-dependent Zn protease
MSREELESKTAVLVGGRAPEDIIYDSGCRQAPQAIW